MQVSAPGSAPTDTALLAPQEEGVFRQCGQGSFAVGVGRGDTFKSQLERGRKKSKHTKLIILKRPRWSPTPARPTGALCQTGRRELCEHKSGSLPCSFI